MSHREFRPPVVRYFRRRSYSTEPEHDDLRYDIKLAVEIQSDDGWCYGQLLRQFRYHEDHPELGRELPTEQTWCAWTHEEITEAECLHDR